MKALAKLGYLAATCALLVITFAIIGPRAVHAVVATLVHDVDNGALQPVNFRLTASQSNSSMQSFTVDGPTVPTGKRLVVEDISVFGLTQSSTALTGVWLVNKGGENYLLVNPETGERSVSSDGSLSQYGYNRPAKAYYDPNDVMEAQIFRDSLTPGAPIPAGLVLVNVYVHGYYVNVP